MSEDTSLPHELRVGKFVEARLTEISALSEAFNAPRCGQNALQQLPRHMRRRAVSHNPKRLPRRIRQRLGKDAEQQQSAKPKRPSRKYRRRPRNLLEEYNRRQRKNNWLETHIWHAKRFHMVDKWGYKVAEKPTDKNFRACYRAAAQKCLMQDISFLNCLELRGPEKELLSELKHLTSEECGPGFGGGDYLDGGHEGRVFVHHPQKYPYGVIGEVSFLWKPKDDNDKSERTLWIWAHPSFYEEFKEALSRILGCAEREESGEPAAKKARPNVGKDDEKMAVNEAKMSTRNIPFDRVPQLKSRSGSVTVALLKGTLNRFRLWGPHSACVLANVLQKTSVVITSEDGAWWTKYYDSEERRKAFERQHEVWSECYSKVNPARVKSGLALPLVVRDPRVLLPKHRGVAVPTELLEDVRVPIDRQDLAESPFWSSSIRDRVTQGKASDHEVNAERSRLLVPGSALPLVDKEARVPVVLIQQGGSDGFGAAWDIVVPAGWGMSFWLNLVYQGARVGGLRESAHLAFEMGRLDIPESKAGSLEREEQKEAAIQFHLRRPPDKRVNYCKLGISSPFSTPWSTLLREYSTTPDQDPEQFFVVRDRKEKEKWSKLVAPHKYASPETPTIREGQLVPIRVELVGRGTLAANSLVCLPTAEDLSTLSGESSFGGPVEPHHDDPDEEERKKARAEHQSRRTALRRAWKRRKDKLVETKAQSTLAERTPDEALVAGLSEAMRKVQAERAGENAAFALRSRALWLRECNALRRSCGRQVVGMVAAGGVSLRVGRPVGLGFAPAAALAHLREQQPDPTLVLVREVNSAQYRFAKLSVA